MNSHSVCGKSDPPTQIEVQWSLTVPHAGSVPLRRQAVSVV